MSAILLFFSLILLILTAVMAWMARGMTFNSGQWEAHLVLWLLIGFCAFTCLTLGAGLATLGAILLVVGFSMAGYLFDGILHLIFPEPPPRTPAK